MFIRPVFPGNIIIKVHNFVTGPFQENTFLIEDRDSKSALFIDPGDEARRLTDIVEQMQITPLAIINTHAHLDHIGAVAQLKDHFGIPFYLHRNEKPVLDSAESAYQMFGLPPQKAPEVDAWLEVDQPLEFGPFGITCIATPGHTPGGVCLRIDDHVFTGDTLFRGSIGRTDLPGGNWTELETSLVHLFQHLNAEDYIHCGHGPDTNRELELSGNSFIRPLQHRIACTDSLPM